MHNKRILVTLILTSVILISVYTASPVKAAPTFTITDGDNHGNHDFGYVGDRLTFSGKGFEGKAVSIVYDGMEWVNTKIDESGNFKVDWVIIEMAGGKCDPIVVLVDGKDAAKSVFAIFPSISLNPETGPKGIEVTVIGNGYSAFPVKDGLIATFEGKELKLDDLEQGHSEGNFRAKFTVPDLKPQTYTVTIYGKADPTIIASEEFTITSISVLPEYPFGGLMALFTCFAMFVLFIKRKNLPKIQLRL